MYGMGLAAIASGDYRLLQKLFTLKMRSSQGREPDAVVSMLHHGTVLLHDAQRALPGRERQFTPLCNHLEQALRAPVREFIPDDSEYRESFDWFEYLLALVHVDLTRSTESLKPSAEGEEVKAWGPIGCFGWRQLRRPEGLFAETELREGELTPEKVAKALQAGLFGGAGPNGYARFAAVKSAFDRHCKQATFSWY